MSGRNLLSINSYVRSAHFLVMSRIYLYIQASAFFFCSSLMGHVFLRNLDSFFCVVRRSIYFRVHDWNACSSVTLICVWLSRFCLFLGNFLSIFRWSVFFSLLCIVCCVLWPKSCFEKQWICHIPAAIHPPMKFMSSFVSLTFDLAIGPTRKSARAPKHHTNFSLPSFLFPLKFVDEKRYLWHSIFAFFISFFCLKIGKKSAEIIHWSSSKNIIGQAFYRC